MKKKITILPGDGIGKEVTACGKKVLEQVAECFGHEFVFDYARIGHEAGRDQSAKKENKKRRAGDDPGHRVNARAVSSPLHARTLSVPPQLRHSPLPLPIAANDHSANS